MIIFFVFLIVSINSYHFDEDDKFIVYHLQAPLFQETLGDLLKAFNAYHFGIGFHNIRTGEEYVSDFIAKPSVLSSIIPKLTTHGVEWEDYSLTRFFPGIINRTYWEECEEVYRINGKQLNDFLDFVHYYNTTVSHYKLMDVFVNGYDEPVMSSFNCIDYMCKGLETLAGLGAEKTIENKTINIDYPWLYIKGNPQPLNYEGNEKKILSFYTNFVKIFNETVFNPYAKSFEQILADTFSLVQNVTNEYIYHFLDKYYTFTVVSPYATFKYEPWIIPV